MRLHASRTFFVEPPLPPSLRPLQRLAANLYWSWNTDAVALFARIDGERWHATHHNPVAVLQGTPRETWARLADDDGFLSHLQRVMVGFDSYLARDPLITIPGASRERPIAYFSLEFALVESFANYSGGLGVLAGDHLKSASDLGLPLVGVGLLYSNGYFHQRLGPDGWQEEVYRLIDLTKQPLQPVDSASGGRLRIDIPVDGRTVAAEVWRLDVGKVPLYLLDTNLESNSPGDRELTARLYGGDTEMRIQQEIVVGIGGVRALRAIGLDPCACHMNEGHSALLGLERIRTLMQDANVSFEVARQPVAAATAFTTHTAVAAGIDLFSPDLVMKYLGEYGSAMGLSREKLLGLGRTHSDDESEPFSMAMLGLRLSGFRNGVSKLHRGVSQRLWESAWPEIPIEQTPIDSVTNGVHLPTWVSHDVSDLYDRYIGPAWRDDPVNTDWTKIAGMPDDELWRVHERERERLISRARRQHGDALMSRGLSMSVGQSGQALDSRALTVGFARRFAGYKRATLLFRDPDRLAALLNHPDRPVQFIFAGKAHPRDEPAKALIREVVSLSARPEFRDRLVLLEDYDLELARVLVQGCDLWLNTPLRPLEASGTSGMKAFANGGINMSVRDGWWWEAYEPGLGWAVGRDRVDDDPEAQDAFDANSIYDLFENEITRAFYERDNDGIPRAWVARMKASIAAFGPVFNTSRMVAEYATRAYAPAAESWQRLTADGLAMAKDLAGALDRIAASWSSVRICDLSEGVAPESQDIAVEARIHPGDLAPSDLQVDAIYGAVGPEGSLMQTGEAPLTFVSRAEDGLCTFRGEIPLSGGGNMGYSVRVLPQHPGLHDPFAPQLAHWA
ncbi:MAG: alpha-glucan family phosphorylase [bacterium]